MAAAASELANGALELATMDDADDQVAARRTHSAGGELGIREPTTDDLYVPYAHSEPRRFPSRGRTSRSGGDRMGRSRR
jgi:hypothetical protein